MQTDIFILSIQAVGRYLIMVFNAGSATDEIKNYLEDNCNLLWLTTNTISFSLEVHENTQDIMQKILEIYDANQS